MAYVIKRYSNRKLYDQQTSRYVTLDEIKQLIRGGTEVRVEDAESGEDLTSLTLTQILLETERTHQPAVPSALLHQLIKHGEAWYDFMDRALRNPALDQLSGTPRDVARFWTDWSTRAGWKPPVEPAPAREAGRAQAAGVDDASSVEDELSALKEQLRALEQRLGRKKEGAGKKPPARPSPRRRR